MAYELNAEHLEIMHKVRENLRARFYEGGRRGSEFICNQIGQVVHEMEGDPDAYRGFLAQDFPLSEAGRATVQALRGAISTAMNGAETLNAYLAEQRAGLIFEWSDVAMARLAWLDKIIETGAIA